MARSAHRKGVAAAILLAAVVTHKLRADRRASDGQVGPYYIMETETWQLGFLVIGRKGNMKRKRMQWRHLIEHSASSPSSELGGTRSPSHLFTEIPNVIIC